jgi:hypothetical protein
MCALLILAPSDVYAQASVPRFEPAARRASRSIRWAGDAELAKKIERGCGIPTAFAVSPLAAPAFASAATRANVSYSFYALHSGENRSSSNFGLCGDAVTENCPRGSHWIDHN